MKKPRVLFVGSFVPMPDGGTGGVTSEALTLFHSGLAEEVEFVLLDSTIQAAEFETSWRSRLFPAAGRLLKFVRLVWRVDALLVYFSDGPSWLEKGLMVVLGRWASRGTVIRPVGAVYDKQCEQSPLFRRWVGFVLRHCNVVLSQGPHWTEFFNTFPGVPEKVMELPNPVALPDLSDRHGPSPSCFHMVHVGWMIPRKGIFEALEVYENVKKARPEATFTLAGGGELLEEFRAKAAHHGESVRALGWVARAEVPTLLERADVFLSPSHAEGLPNSVLEAMASAVPVVVTRVGSLPDLIRDGENGLLVDVGDIDGMTRAVLSLADDPDRARRVGLNGRKSMEERHTITRNAELVGQALTRAAGEVGRPGKAGAVISSSKA